MRWVNHKIVTATLVYSMTGGLIATFVSMSAAHLPDLLELRGAIPHRTITHWVILWLFFSIISLWLLLHFNTWTFYVCLFVVVGGLCHVFEDFLSVSGVPFLQPYGRRIGLGLYITNADGEWITSTGLSTIFVSGAAYRGFFTPNHLLGEINSISNLISSVWS